jgi:hypothetical protein
MALSEPFSIGKTTMVSSAIDPGKILADELNELRITPIEL